MLRWIAKTLLDTLNALNSATASSPDCARARAQIPALIDEEAEGADADALPHRAWLLAHLNTCATCREAYNRQSIARHHLPDTEIAALADALNNGENVRGTWMEDALAHCALCSACASDLARVRGAR